MSKKFLLSLGMFGAISFAFLVNIATSATVEYDAAPLSINTSGGDPNYYFSNFEISGDGRYVVYTSSATDIVSTSTLSKKQVYLYDRASGNTLLVSKNSSGNAGNNNAGQVAISSNGRYVAYSTNASNIVAGDTNNKSDVFLYDHNLDTTTLVSKSSSGTIGNGTSANPGGVSSDGNLVVFSSTASNLVSSPSTTDGIYFKNIHSGEVRLLTQSTSGVAANASVSGATLSCEGRYATFQSVANNLVAGDDTINPSKTKMRIYYVDTLADSIEPQYFSPNNTNYSYGRISCSGEYISFVSQDSLLTADTNAKNDVYLYDIANDELSLASSDSSGTVGNNNSSYSDVSGDGRFVVFDSTATNLVTGDTNATTDVFIKDMKSGGTERVSVAYDLSNTDGLSYNSRISDNGEYIAFKSVASNVVDGFSNPYGNGFAMPNNYLHPY